MFHWQTVHEFFSMCRGTPSNGLCKESLTILRSRGVCVCEERPGPGRVSTRNCQGGRLKEKPPFSFMQRRLFT